MGRTAYGDGTIFKRGNGRWEAQVFVTQTNGTRKRVCVSGKSREIVKTKLRGISASEERRIPYSSNDWSVSGYLDYWMRDIQSKRVRETTMTTYKVMIEKHIKPAMGGHKLQNLSVYNVREALALMSEHGCSNRVQLECLRIMSACLACAMREEVIFRNVAQLVEKPKYMPKEKVIWTAEQARLFLAANENHTHYAALLLFVAYGMRRGEVLGLRWSDIDFGNGIIHIRQQIDRINGKIKARDLKTVNSRRDIPLKPFVRAALLCHAARNNVTIPPFNPYFELSTQGTVILSSTGKPLEPRVMNRLFNALVKKSGLSHATPHFMRHIAATVLKDLKIPDKDIQAILGHADITTTIKYYQHSTPDTRHEAISAVENLLFGLASCKK